MSQRRISKVLIIGAGPVGLLIGSLLRDQGLQVTIVEKRRENTRTRCVKLLGEVLLLEMKDNEVNVLTEKQIEKRKQAIDLIKTNLYTMIFDWLDMCTPIRTIQEELKSYFLSSGGKLEEYDFSQNFDVLQQNQDTLVIDCTGYNSVLRNHIQPNNLVTRSVEHVMMCTFTYADRYYCNELCKYYKNRDIRKFHIIPSVDETYVTGDRQTHLTCLITINEDIYKQLSTIRPLTYDRLKANQPEIDEDLNRFLKNLSFDNLAKIHFDTMEFVALPLNVYRAKKMTHMNNNNNLNQPWVLMGDAAMGAPYFQSISRGFQAAIYFAYLFRNMSDNIEQVMDEYQDYMHSLWIINQVRSEEIKKNKTILQALRSNDPDTILRNIKIY